MLAVLDESSVEVGEHAEAEAPSAAISWLQLISAAVSCRSASGISAQSGKGQSSTGCQASQWPFAVSRKESSLSGARASR